MNDRDRGRCPRRIKWQVWFVGLGSLVWLVLRSGFRPYRLAYPCQRAALANVLGGIGYALPLLGWARLRRRVARRITPSTMTLVALFLLIPLGLRRGSAAVSPPVFAVSSLSGWTSPSAVSDVFVVSDVPAPPCALDGGALPGTPPCNVPSFALRDEGVDALIDLMQSRGTYLHETAAHPGGIVGADDVVVIKVNNQWGGRGSAEGSGRLATNTDVLKGLIWRILQHPDGFTGEIVVAENTQPTSDTSWNVTPANAENQGQSFQDVVSTFQSLGYPVSLFAWTGLNNTLVQGGSIGDPGYPAGEYIHGDMRDAYILLEDPAGTGRDELSYPKFQSANGAFVSMRYGIWNGSSYDAERLTFVNLPVLKRHGMAGATIAWKNLLGYVTCADHDGRYGGYGEMHDFFFGHVGGPDRDYGLVGRQMALIRSPDLHVVDAIWIAYESNHSGKAVRQDVLLASTDPFAVDWYASDYILYPITGQPDSSAARAGTFRNASRINQNAAQQEWHGGAGSYPYIDLLDGYDGGTPVEAERKQMSVYVSSSGKTSLMLVAPNGGEIWRTGSQYSIQWSWSGEIESVRLSYSTDGFKSVTHSIAASTPNDGIYTWTTPVTPLNSVRVRVADPTHADVYDDSDADFVLLDVRAIVHLPLLLYKGN